MDMSREQAIELQRDLAIKAKYIDDFIRIPFTRQGVGADAVAGVVPFVGDLAGLLMAVYAIAQARRFGVPLDRLAPAAGLAALDLTLGLVPGAGDVLDVFVRPSKQAIRLVNDYLSEQYGITSTIHIDRPIMHRFLQQKQAESRFWSDPRVEWITLHLPDLVMLVVLVCAASAVWSAVRWLAGLFG